MQNGTESNGNNCDTTLSGKRILLGVTGSIAAYKAAYIASSLVKSGADVHVVMTESATKLIAPATFWSITSNPVLTEMFEKPARYEITHISLPESSDLFLIAPATANIIGKIANGIADDMLSTMALSARCPMVIAPAMNTNMYTNPVVTANMERLKQYDRVIVEPESGRLACGDTGIGRLAEPDKIINVVESILAGIKKDYFGVRVLVSAGPTQEAIDPVRFISNRSSGKMGYAIAANAAKRGAQVTLISGPSDIKDPEGVDVIRITSSHEMYNEVIERIDDVDIFISAAAPADFTPADKCTEKIKKTDRLTLEFEKSRDILKACGERKKNTILVGFAAETNDLIANAKVKLESKNLDLIIGNDVSEKSDVFGSDTNQVVLIPKNGDIIQWPKMSKTEVANGILDFVRLNFLEETR